MGTKGIRFEIDQVKNNLEEMKKHISSLFGGVMWDIDKELKSDPDYFKKEISKEILEAWKHIERLEDLMKEIDADYKLASKEPEEIELEF